MRIIEKKVCCLVLALIVAFSMSLNVFAVSNNVIHMDVSSISVIPYDSDEMYTLLAGVGFTDEEMFDLYQREANETGTSILLPDKLADAIGKDYAYTETPNRAYRASTPQNGDIRYDTINISFDDIARGLGWAGTVGGGAAFIISQVTKDAFIRAVVTSAGLGWANLIVSAAGLAFSELARHHSGMIITVKYMYQYDSYEGFGKWYMVDATWSMY